MAVREAALNPPARGPARYLRSSTGTFDPAITFVATEPITRFAIAVWPCVPIATRSQPDACAWRAISWPGSPTSLTGWNATPRFVRISAAGFSAWSLSSE